MSRRDSKRKSMRDGMRKRSDKEKEGGGQSQWLKNPEDVEFLEIKGKTNYFTILPYLVKADDHPYVEPGSTWFQRDVYVHYNIGVDKKSYTCPKMTYNKPCPVCEYRAQLARADEPDEKLIDSLAYSRREIFNVLPEGGRAPDDIMLFTTAYGNFGAKLQEEIDEAEDDPDRDYVLDFAEVVNCSELKVRFVKKSWSGNPFFKASRIDFLERDDHDESILDQTYDLDSLVNCLSYDELKKRLWETMDGDGSCSAPDDDDRGRGRGRRDRGRKSDRGGRGGQGRGRGSSRRGEDTDDDKDAKSDKSRSRGRSGRGRKSDDGDDRDDKRSSRRSSGRRSKPKDDDKKSQRSGRGRGRGRDDDDGDDKSPEGECPFGHRFGVDTNEFKDCDNCDEWNPCQDAWDARQG